MSNLNYSGLVEQLRTSFNSRKTRPIEWRIEQLKNFRRMLEEREFDIIRSLRSDIKESNFEAYFTDIGTLLGEIDHALRHLSEWMAPQKVSTPLVMQPGTSKVVSEPLGVALIIGAWNYPFYTTLAPLVPAIAAGNCAILKPSELAPHTAEAMAKLIPEYLDEECYQVINGGVEETSALLEEQFDKIFFTGGGRVGKIIMTAAAKHLTPVTLELGGKSPCIVDSHANLKVTARRICQGKLMNAGQTCVAPDYLLVHEDIHDDLIEAMKGVIDEFYEGDPKGSPNLARIINEQHHDRLTKLLDSGNIVIGGEHDRENCYIAPTVMTDVSPDSPVMQEEIFGPILPVIKIPNLHQAVNFINKRDKPLALYIFSEDKHAIDYIVEETSAGGMTINDTLLHLTVPNLPFGGVGPSGMGKYHGKWGFDDFSNAKAVFNHSTAIDPDLRYPPFSESDQKILYWTTGGKKKTK